MGRGLARAGAAAAAGLAAPVGARQKNTRPKPGILVLPKGRLEQTARTAGDREGEEHQGLGEDQGDHHGGEQVAGSGGVAGTLSRASAA